MYQYSQRGEDAMKRLTDQGFTLPDIPNNRPYLPEDITSIDDETLMNLFALLTAWSDFASTQYALAAIEEREAERRLTLAEGRAWKELPAKTAVSASKAIVASDADVVEMTGELDVAHAYRKLVGEQARNYERDATLVSRELTRRTSEFSPKSRRKDRWTT